jgi:hypothetical protein
MLLHLACLKTMASDAGASVKWFPGSYWAVHFSACAAACKVCWVMVSGCALWDHLATQQLLQLSAAFTVLTSGQSPPCYTATPCFFGGGQLATQQLLQLSAAFTTLTSGQLPLFLYSNPCFWGPTGHPSLQGHFRQLHLTYLCSQRGQLHWVAGLWQAG